MVTAECYLYTMLINKMIEFQFSNSSIIFIFSVTRRNINRVALSALVVLLLLPKVRSAPVSSAAASSEDIEEITTEIYEDSSDGTEDVATSTRHTSTRHTSTQQANTQERWHRPCAGKSPLEMASEDIWGGVTPSSVALHEYYGALEVRAFAGKREADILIERYVSNEFHPH